MLLQKLAPFTRQLTRGSRTAVQQSRGYAAGAQTLCKDAAVVAWEPLAHACFLWHARRDEHGREWCMMHWCSLAELPSACCCRCHHHRPTAAAPPPSRLELPADELLATLLGGLLQMPMERSSTTPGRSLQVGALRWLGNGRGVPCSVPAGPLTTPPPCAILVLQR